MFAGGPDLEEGWDVREAKYRVGAKDFMEKSAARVTGLLVACSTTPPPGFSRRHSHTYAFRRVRVDSTVVAQCL